MAKSRDAFRTISEVSDWLDTPAHVLRFWESRFSQIKPVKRAGGRRYYRPNDMLLLGGIKRLLHDDGLTIKGVQKILREKGLKYVSSLSHDLNATAEVAAEETPIEAIIDDTPEISPEIIEPVESADESTPEEEFTPEPAPVAHEDAFAEPEAQAFETTDESADRQVAKAEEPVAIASVISDIADDAAPFGDRLSVLYRQLEALRDRVQAQMQAA